MTDGNKFHTPDDSYMVQVLISLPHTMLTELNGCLTLGTYESNWLQVGDLTPAECASIFDSMIMEKTMLTGSIIPWFGQELPTWGLLCDGSLYSKDQYPALWAVIVDHFKTPSQFAVPDLRGMFLKGVETANDTGEVLGSMEAQIEVGHLPPHTHTMDGIPGLINGGALPSLPVVIPGPSVTGSSGSGYPLDITNLHMGMRMVIVK